MERQHMIRTNSSRRGRGAHRWTAGAIAAGVTLAAAGSVFAAPIERGSFHDKDSETFVDFCGDLDMIHSWDISGTFLAVARGSTGLVHFRDSVRGTDVWTNTETGRSYTQKWTANSRDLKVTDNGDGTLTILVQASGGARFYDGDGKLVLRDPGLVRFEILVDHNGTPSDPSDDKEIEFLGIVKGSTGLNETEGRDFCDDIILFTS
jgi:hypothetical protein